jgi:hypothetical protein
MSIESPIVKTAGFCITYQGETAGKMVKRRKEKDDESFGIMKIIGPCSLEGEIEVSAGKTPFCLKWRCAPDRGRMPSDNDAALVRRGYHARIFRELGVTSSIPETG